MFIGMHSVHEVPIENVALHYNRLAIVGGCHLTILNIDLNQPGKYYHLHLYSKVCYLKKQVPFQFLRAIQNHHPLSLRWREQYTLLIQDAQSL